MKRQWGHHGAWVKVPVEGSGWATGTSSQETGLFSGPIQEVLLPWSTQSVRGLFPPSLLSLPITPQSKNQTLLANDDRLGGVFSTRAPHLGSAPGACHPDLALGSGPRAQVVTWPGQQPPSSAMVPGKVHGEVEACVLRRQLLAAQQMLLWEGQPVHQNFSLLTANQTHPFIFEISQFLNGNNQVKLLKRPCRPNRICLWPCRLLPGADTGTGEAPAL